MNSVYDIVVSLVLYKTSSLEVQKCVHQLISSQARSHIIIVDNSPSPVKLPDYSSDRVTVIRPGANLGYGRAHNRAIGLTKGLAPFHLIMNTDVVFMGDVLEQMLTFMKNNTRVGMSSPLILYPDGRLQTQCRLLPSPINLLARGFLDKTALTRRMNRIYEMKDWAYDSIENIPFLPGCFMMIRSDILETVGGFDERFFLFGEDLDLSRRIYRISQCVFVPTVTIQHELRSRAHFSYQRHLYKTINIVRYFNKWGWINDRERRSINLETRRHIFGKYF